jgi:outer membrane protein assembly factor BamB
MNRKAFTPNGLLIALVLVFMLSGISFASDWLSWRGPNGNGISTETGWNPKALTNPKIVWKINVGKGHSCVAVQGNYLYTMGNNPVTSGKDAKHEDVVYCIDNRTGKEIWRYSYPCKEGRFPGPRSTPVINGSSLFTISQEGHLFCFNAKNGMVKWTRNILAEGLSKLSDWGFSFSTVIEGDMLILNAGKSGIALNKKNGKVIWKSAPEKCGLGTPVLFNFNKKRLAAIQGDNTIYTVDVKTGELQWTYKWTSDADPIVFNKNLIYLSAGNARTKRGRALLKIKDGEPEELWFQKNNNYAFQSWVVLNGYAYGLRYDNKAFLLCVDIKTGEEKWNQVCGDYGGLMAADGKLILLKGNGILAIVEASPEAYKKISSARVIKMKDLRSYPQEIPNTCWTAPVLSNGHIYCRNTYGDLVCVDMK